MSEAETTIPVGTVVGGRWRIAGFLGAGGFGQVLLAEDVSEVGLGQAAVKVLHPNTSPQERQAFLHEVKKIAVLRHQNLVGYLDSGQLRFDGVSHEGLRGQDTALPDLGGEIRPYLVTELCEMSLADHLAAAPGGVLSVEETIGVMVDATSGLDHLHERGLIHRDIKPGNALYADGRWKLADFGLMRDLTASGAYHRGEFLVGTPLFMAPELFSTSTATAASDVYALGVVAHHCVTGRALHAGSGPALVHNIATQPPTIDPSLPGDLADLVRWCTTQEPAHRPTAAQLLDWLRRTTSSNPTIATSSPAPPPLRSNPTIGPPAAAEFGALGSAPLSPAGPDAYRAPHGQGWPPPSGPHPNPAPQHDQGQAEGTVPRWLVPVGAIVLVLALAGMALGLFVLSRDDSNDVAGPGLDPAQDTTTLDPGGASTASVLGTQVASTDPPTDGGEGSPESTAGAGATSAVADPLTHLVDEPCSSGSVDQVVVANLHDQAVDYRLTINHHDQGGVRIGESFDTATAVPPGGSALLAMTPFEDGAVSCDIAELVATPTDPFLLDDFDIVDVEQCDRTSDTGADVTFTVTNPLEVSASIEVSIVVADPSGVIIDEWFSEGVDQVAPGERVRTEVNWTYFNLGAADPSAPIDCVVSWLDLEPS